jgi:predicted PolB exonuclease-like 3'-5' exonuclease
MESSNHVIVWDLETTPDLVETDAAGASAHIGDKFPKHLWHEIVCIGALVATRVDEHWEVRALGAPHVGQRPERELIESFVTRIAELRPRLVGFNTNSFDLPVLRYRAMLHRVRAPGLACRPYFRRYTDDAEDLCDIFGSFGSAGKATLNEICRTLGLDGKTEGIDGSKVRQLVQEGRIAEVASYCLQDVICSFRLWLIHELFCARLTE